MPLWLRVLIGIGFMSLVLEAPAQTPAKAPTLPDLDKLALDVLKDVHNRGANLNNTGNADACYYMYEGGLRVVKPFLAHRPQLQKIIDTGLDEVTKTEGTKIKAFRLHEVIEQVRTELKKELKKAPASTPTESTNPMPTPMIPMPNPKEPTRVAPTPKPAATEGDVKGSITLDGKPLGGAFLTVVTTDKVVPRVLSVIVSPDGKYSFDKPLAPGEYAMMVTHDNTPVPERYQTTLTSGLRFSVRAGANTMDLKLVSK